MYQRHLRPLFLAASAGLSALLPLAAGLTPFATAHAVQNNLNQMGADWRTQRRGRLGRNVRIAILDTPIDINHSDLRRGSRPMARYQRLHRLNNRVISSHGTMVAGIIGGKRGTGIARSAQLYDVSVLSPYNGYWASNRLTTRRALNAARSVRASIANLSWGMSGGRTLGLDEFLGIRRQSNRILVVKAAGNDGRNLRSTIAPGRAQDQLRNLILVGSIGRTNQISSFSNRPGEGCFATYNNPGHAGSWTCREGDKYKYFFLTAPGERIRTTRAGRGYTRGNGTSFSTAHVTGAAALLQARWPFLKRRPAHTANILFRTANDLGAPGVDPVYGWGSVNVRRAISPVGMTLLGSSDWKFYPTAASTISGTGPLFRMVGWGQTISSLSIFDEYERDFTVDAETFDFSTDDSLATHMTQALSSGVNPALDAVGGSFDFPLTSQLTAGFSFHGTEQLSDGHNEPGQIEHSFISYREKDRMGGNLDFWRMDLRGSLDIGGADAGHWLAFAGSGAPQGVLMDDLDQMRSPLFGDASRLTQPLLGLARSQGTSMDTGLQLGLGDWSVTAGFARSEPTELEDTRYQAHAPYLKMSFAPGEDWKLGLAYAHLTEEAGLFGGYGSGVFNLGEGFTTQALTLSSSWAPTENWNIAAA
ncbi:MAG: S8 family peptidase, partial [Gammaproteobacteria bacterium]